MNIKEVEILLDKYFEGMTTAEEEEKILRFFRNSRDLPQNLEKLRPMFEGISMQGTEQPDERFEKEASERIDYLYIDSAKRRFTGKVYLVTGVAAAIVAGLIYMSIWRSPENTVNKNLFADTYSDPQKGYEAAKAIMGYVSGNYRKGLGQLNNIPAYSEETSSLFKALEMYNRGFSKLEVITNINIK